MIQKSTFQFLSQLKKNNEKGWFDEHRTEYLGARENVIAFLEGVLQHLAKLDGGYGDIKAASCLFRINRDVRFSANKAPYKTNFGASLSPHGKKSGMAGFYVHIEPGDCFVGGGLWMPPNPIVYKVRQEIDYQTDEFLGIIKQTAFKKAYGDLDYSDSLKKLPREFGDTHRAEPYLKLKSFIALKSLPDAGLTAPNAALEVAKTLWALNPMIQFLNRGLTD
jgi:uncharacterized protein (TIGR02453 family)